MRQHLIHNADQGREAVEAGAMWLTLASPTPEAIGQLIPVCNSAGIIFVIEGNPDLALNTLVDDVRVSGVCIGKSDGDPAQIREKLGPHAIVGYAADSATEILALAGLDIDYFTLPVAEMTESLAEVETPIVAVGVDYTPAGFSGHLN